LLVAGFSITPTNPTAGDPVFFNGGSSTSDTPIITYHWDFGDGAGDSSSGMEVTHIYSVTGVYTTSLTIMDVNDMSSLPTAQQVNVTAPILIPKQRPGDPSSKPKPRGVPGGKLPHNTK
jgi:PKD repeat protein